MTVVRSQGLDAAAVPWQSSLPWSFVRTCLLGNRGSEPTVPAPESQCGSLPGGCGAAEGRPRGEGPRRSLKLRKLSLGPTWWPHRPLLHKQTIQGADRGCAWSPRARRDREALCGSGGCRPGCREDRWAITGLRKGFLLKPVGKQVRTRAGKLSLWGKKNPPNHEEL